MTPTGVRRSNRVHGSLICGATGAALLVHVLALGAFTLLGMFADILAPHAAAALPPEPEEVDLKTTCAGDARLASIARGALCLAPWSTDVETCLEQTELMMRI